MINRAALILKYKQPAIDWINEIDPDEDADQISLESVNKERMVYLIPDQAAFDEDTVRMWVELNQEALFKNELEDWYNEESLWPDELSLELFDTWFEVECHSVVIDTSDEPIVEEYFEEEDKGEAEVH